jgi:O-antigen ligase
VVVGAAAFGLVELASHSPRWSARLSLSSPSRTSVASAAWHTWSDHRLTGAGPGPIVFIWTTPGHQTLIDSYAHDEYLQLAAQEGVVGLIGLAALMVGVVAAVRRGWRSRPLPTLGRLDDTLVMQAGALAGLAAFAVHSGFDFLWHVPVVPLIAAVTVGLAAALPKPRKMFHPQPQRQTQEVS